MLILLPAFAHSLTTRLLFYLGILSHSASILYPQNAASDIADISATINAIEPSAIFSDCAWRYFALLIPLPAFAHSLTARLCSLILCGLRDLRYSGAGVLALGSVACSGCPSGARESRAAYENMPQFKSQ